MTASEQSNGTSPVLRLKTLSFCSSQNQQVTSAAINTNPVFFSTLPSEVFPGCNIQTVNRSTSQSKLLRPPQSRPVDWWEHGGARTTCYFKIANSGSFTETRECAPSTSVQAAQTAGCFTQQASTCTWKNRGPSRAGLGLDSEHYCRGYKLPLGADMLAAQPMLNCERRLTWKIKTKQHSEIQQKRWSCRTTKLMKACILNSQPTVHSFKAQTILEHVGTQLSCLPSSELAERAALRRFFTAALFALTDCVFKFSTWTEKKEHLGGTKRNQHSMTLSAQHRTAAVLLLSSEPSSFWVERMSGCANQEKAEKCRTGRWALWSRDVQWTALRLCLPKCASTV